VLALVCVAALAVLGLGAALVRATEAPASASTVSFSQCNGHAAGPLGAPLSVSCSISIVNNIDANGGGSAVVYVRTCTLEVCTGDTVSSSDVINAVHQCNASDNVGGSTTTCSVDIVNNISGSSPAAATAIALDQCNGSGGGGGTNMTACLPSGQSSPVVTQCNGSGTGGGGFMVCTASGTTSAAFPVTVDQCNGSENGGGSTVTCTTTITTNIFDTTTGPSGPPSTPTTEAPPTPTTGAPGTPGGPGAPGTPGTPGSPSGGAPGTGSGTGTGTITGVPGSGTPGAPPTELEAPPAPPAVIAPPTLTA
jgi:hypothetical protein